MAKYVKVCPRCGHVNDEFSEVCATDGEFLGMVPATPAADLPRLRATPALETVEATDEPAPQLHSEPPSRALYLDIGESEKCYEIRSGWTIGQAHSSSSADVQLNDLPGLQYVHRRHCQFEYGENGWHIVALLQPAYTNPTSVNDRLVTPGERATLHNGDRLTLSSLTFTVRIFEL